VAKRLPARRRAASTPLAENWLISKRLRPGAEVLKAPIRLPDWNGSESVGGTEGISAFAPEQVCPACHARTSYSPNSGIAASSTSRPCAGIGARACFAEAAGVAEVLAVGPIRGGLQARVAGPSRSGAVTPAFVGSPLLTDGRSVLRRASVPRSRAAKRRRRSVRQRH